MAHNHRAVYTVRDGTDNLNKLPYAGPVDRWILFNPAGVQLVCHQLGRGNRTPGGAGNDQLGNELKLCDVLAHLDCRLDPSVGKRTVEVPSIVGVPV